MGVPLVILCTFVGGILGFVVLVVIERLSFLLFGRGLSNLIFVHSGLQALIAPMAGCILGWIWGNKLKDNQEQASLAKSLGINQAAVSKMERRTDMYISTLREFVVAMGDELEITARFPDGVIRIQQFEDA